MSRTNGQDDMWVTYQAQNDELMDLLLGSAVLAMSEVVKLPHTNEQGEAVMHRDNLDMMEIRDTYKQMALELYKRLPKDRKEYFDTKFGGWRRV